MLNCLSRACQTCEEQDETLRAQKKIVYILELELELELIQTQMAQKPRLRADVYAHAMRASQNRKKGSA